MDRRVQDALNSGDYRRALALLMDCYGDEVFRYAVAMTRDRTFAEEVRQQVFVQAYRDLGRGLVPDSASKWLFGITRHRCLDAVKASSRWMQRYKNDEEIELTQEEHEPSRALDMRRLARFLADCLARLAPAARDAVILRFQQELSYDEVAAITGDQAATLRQRVARALPVLRKCLETTLQGDRP